MVELFKKIIFLILFLISLIGCSAGNKLPEERPKDFNFVFNYGVNAKNKIDTIKGQYTKDMITEPSVTTDLILSDEEMNSIYFELKNINILNYPDNFNPKSNMLQTPFETYLIKIVINGKEKNINWKDENISNSKDAIKLRDLFNKIEKMIIQKEEYKKLPPAKGGYV